MVQMTWDFSVTLPKTWTMDMWSEFFFKNMTNNCPILEDGLNKLWVIWGISIWTLSTHFGPWFSTIISTKQLDFKTYLFGFGIWIWVSKGWGISHLASVVCDQKQGWNYLSFEYYGADNCAGTLPSFREWHMEGQKLTGSALVWIWIVVTAKLVMEFTAWEWNS